MKLLDSARSKPATWVPPLGVATMFTNERTSVSYPSPQRTAMSTVQIALDVGRRHVPGVVEHRHGLGEVTGAGQPDHLGHLLVGGEELAELD